MKFGYCLITMLTFAKTLNGFAAETSSPDPTNAPPGSNAPKFEVHGYLVEGNTVLPPETFGMLSNYTGAAVDLPRILQGLGEVQLRYRELGFPTVSVTLPQQKLTNGLVRVQITEGRLSDIVVVGNRYYSSSNVRRALPSLTTNVLINSKWFQPELDMANANPDRQIYPVVGPGPDPGTTALALKVKDRLPLHGHIEINDKSTPGTPLLRVDSALQYNNLWQLNHQLGVQYNFSPPDMKPDRYSPNIFDQPMMASYSGFYRIPLGFDHGLRETYDRLPVDFGYDQVSHKFNLPSPTGNPELTFYASRSTSDTPVRLGPLTLITNTALADISSQFAQRDLTFNNSLGARLTMPIREFAGVRSSMTLGFDVKTYEAQSFSTNLFHFSLYDLVDGVRTLENNQTLPFGANSRITLQYLPLALGWAGARADRGGSTSLNFNGNVFLEGLASERSSFQLAAGSVAAGGNYTTLGAGLAREQKLPHEWSLLLRANGQWSSAPLINNEQFSIGGTSGVRGYREGEVYGDRGWRALFDLRAPPVNIGYFPTEKDSIPAVVRCSWFMDYGSVYNLERPASTSQNVTQWGTGLSAFLTASEHFDARLTVAWALRQTAISPAGGAQAYFSVGFQF